MENRKVVIDSLPKSQLKISNYQMIEGDVPEPKPGELLCRTLVVSIDAGSRAGLQGSASYAGAPTSGIVMNGAGIARVEKTRVDGISEGAIVSCSTGWQDYSIQSADGVYEVDQDVDPAHYLGVLGNSGLTAYFGLLNITDPQKNETVLVSAAAGAVGHIVGQIATIHGAKAVGVAGVDTKCNRLVEELSFKGAVNYKDPNFRQSLKEATPNGVDIYFDNTGGMVLGSALFRMNDGGRISCCGVVSQYDTKNPEPGPKGIPGLLVNKRLRMEGFLVFDYVDQYESARSQLKEWLLGGKLIAWQDEFEGLEKAPEAFVDLLRGGNVGKRIVRVST
ncbi:MAG: NADP-dependent oxidoreductase [Pseudomonadales bacterium]|nr:NADP-dependent oxidoreductase [Pseudomonadales bacterium]